MRVRVYVDGFNLYYGGKRLAARHNGGKVPTWKWLDLRALASRITEQRFTVDASFARPSVESAVRAIPLATPRRTVAP